MNDQSTKHALMTSIHRNE